MTEPQDDDDANTAPRTIDPGFAAFQLAKALTAGERHVAPEARERAARRIATWKTILDNLSTDSVSYGSRTPLANVPAWATLEVATGGFATGALVAGGPLRPFERQLLARIGAPERDDDRLALNRHFLTEDGLAELQARLRSGHFDVQVPEEGALAAVAWLADNGHAEAAGSILEAIAPFFGTLRFYPVPDYRARHFGPRVHVQEVAATRANIARIRPNRRVVAQKTAAEVWAPLYDRTVALFLETVADGWPCQHRPPDWSTRAGALLADYERLHQTSDIPSKYRKPGSHYAQLHDFLRRSATSFDPLTGRDVGRIRLILQRSIDKRGLPSTPGSDAIRRRQRDDVRAPLHKDVARIVEERLAACPQNDGLDDIAPLGRAVTPDECNEAVPMGTPVPRQIARKLERCMNETPELLVRRGLISSGDALAEVLPQMTSGLRSIGIEDPALRGLYAAVYRAFRRRRSLLLLNLQSQVRIDELPWVAAIDSLRNASQSSRAAARQALEETVLLALECFPHALLPNKLVRELGTLAAAADIDMPLVDELAVDIFMGEFSDKFLEAAKLAGTLLHGSLYATYYAIDYEAIARMGQPQPPSAKSTWLWQQKARPDDFAALCATRAGVPPGTRRTVANGMIVEQQQILTTQNLAALIVRLDLEDRLRSRSADFAKSCFTWICARHRMPLDNWHARLIRVKNTAYAWRQMVFFLALLPKQETIAFLDWADALLAKQAPDSQKRLQPALAGIRTAVDGNTPAPGTRLLGWTDGKHWLLD